LVVRSVGLAIGTQSGKRGGDAERVLEHVSARIGDLFGRLWYSRAKEVETERSAMRKNTSESEKRGRGEILDGMTTHIYPMWTSSPSRVIISIRAPVRTNATTEIHICSAQIATKKRTNTFLPKNQYYETKKNICARAYLFSFRRSDN
jgi:hypothetical protein